MPHRKCKFVGEEACKLTASFGFSDGKGTQYCSKHKVDGMINLLCKLCQCGRVRPIYNMEGLSANYCIKCKTEGMVNVNDKLCSCGTSSPTFNLSGLKPEFCSKCKTPEMINVVNDPCVCGKSTRPNFNYYGLKPKYCSLCKLENMINVSHKKCKCGKSQPSFNFKDLKPEYCGKCKEEGMKLISKRTCIQCNVNQATYNLYGLKARYCNQCKTSDMINVTDKCKNENCTGSGNIKYKYYCTFCFQHLFPDDELTKNMKRKTKENYVRDFINSKFNDFIHDKPMWTGNCDCSHKRRIDHRMLIGNTLLCIETDERQHLKYNKKDEELRYDDLYMIHGGKFVFIRFNPDKFTNSLGTKKNPSMSYRMEILENEIKKQMERINNNENSELLEIVYIFYDGFEYFN